MLQQAIDFKNESDSLYKILKNIKDDAFRKETQFKSWTINDVLYHLNVWNNAALLSLKSKDKFQEFLQDFISAVKSGISPRDFEKKLSENLDGQELLFLWKKTYEMV